MCLHRSEHCAHIHSFNLHHNTMKLELLLSLLYREMNNFRSHTTSKWESQDLVLGSLTPMLYSELLP